MPASGNGTPGNIQGPFTDGTGTYYTVGGQKSYVSPVALGTGSAPGGGVFTNSGTFNNDTGKFDQGINWGNVLSMVVAGALTAGAATAMLGGSAEAASAVSQTIATGEVPSQFAALPGAVASEGGVNGAFAATTPTLEGTSAGLGEGAGSTVPVTADPIAGGGAAIPDPELAATTGGPAGGSAATTVPNGLTNGLMTDAAGNVLPNAPVGGVGGTGAGVLNHLMQNPDGSTVPTAPDSSSSLGNLSDLINAGAKGLGAAATATGNNAIAGANAQVGANNSNNQGQLDFQNELLAREKAEATERSTDLKNIYRASYAASPSSHTSPYDPAGPPVYSAAYLSALNNLSNQGSTALATAPQYSTTGMSAIPQPGVVNPANLANPAGTVGTISNWVSPIATGVGTLAKIAGWSF